MFNIINNLHGLVVLLYCVAQKKTTILLQNTIFLLRTVLIQL